MDSGTIPDMMIVEAKLIIHEKGVQVMFVLYPIIAYFLIKCIISTCTISIDNHIYLKTIQLDTSAYYFFFTKRRSNYLE